MSGWSGKQNTVESKLIINQPFWPALDLAEFINQYRTPSDLPVETVEAGLMLSMASVNSRLNSYRQQQQAAGIDALDNVPTEQINNQSIQLILYKRAVFCQAKASILRDWPSIDRRSEAENQARSSEETEDRYLEFTDEAIARFLGRGFINAESL
ncbi:head completion/stabilization protein [Endozoicomonas ascidiicola]|uniref:head completion/stabilization protein n=1 Tax=Endozoicomonas ascidiicola TaxID=1698521 RepID=UPI00082C2179|nr:head completion/stabilization protein [Endozoicomonas ascidiicola]